MLIYTYQYQVSLVQVVHLFAQPVSRIHISINTSTQPFSMFMCFKFQWYVLSMNSLLNTICCAAGVVREGGVISQYQHVSRVVHADPDV